MSNYPPGVMLPSEAERKQIFYWLKRISSYTAWNRILGYYRAWAKITEKSVQVASERGWSDRTGIPEGDFVLILQCLAHCEEGVRRLRKGDKRIFKYDANGEFVMADRMLSYWAQMKWRIEVGENGIDETHTPYWPEFIFALTQLSEAWSECSSKIIEPEDINAPSLTGYNPTMRDQTLPTMIFPKDLPEVPDPVRHTLVSTGKTAPFSGIWEPVDVPKPKGFRLFGTSPVPEGPLALAGTMSYLHGGSNAPKARIIKDAKSAYIDTTWRLLWRDDRYEDGTLPEEESSYVFQKPDPTLAAPEPEELRGGLRIWSDTPCPYPGVWQCFDKPLGPQTIAFSVPMPRVQGERVLWRLMKAV
jgi:hypothetical protein